MIPHLKSKGRTGCPHRPSPRRTTDIMLRSIFAVGVLASSLSSAADEKKDDRKSVKDTELKKSSSAGPATNLAGDIARKKTESGKSAPAMSLDQFRVGIET